MDWELIAINDKNEESIINKQSNIIFQNRYDKIKFNIDTDISIFKLKLNITKVNDPSNNELQIAHVHFYGTNIKSKLDEFRMGDEVLYNQLLSLFKPE